MNAQPATLLSLPAALGGIVHRHLRSRSLSSLSRSCHQLAAETQAERLSRRDTSYTAALTAAHHESIRFYPLAVLGVLQALYEGNASVRRAHAQHVYRAEAERIATACACGLGVVHPYARADFRQWLFATYALESSAADTQVYGSPASDGDGG